MNKFDHYVNDLRPFFKGVVPVHMMYDEVIRQVRTRLGLPIVSGDWPYYRAMAFWRHTNQTHTRDMWAHDFGQVFHPNTDGFTALEDRLVEVWRRTPEPEPEPEPVPRRGPVWFHGLGFKDTEGAYAGLGYSFFWSAWGWRHDRQRHERNARWMASQCPWNYARKLSMVGSLPYWDGRVIDPFGDGHDRRLRDEAAWCFDVLGQRTALVVFADAQAMMPDGADRRAYLDRMLTLINARPELWQSIELANEYPLNGLNLDELRFYTRYVQDRTDIPTAASSHFDEAGPAALHADDGHGFVGDFGTPHYDREIRLAEGPYRPVRQPWGWTHHDGAYPERAVNDEPIGPGSSGETETDPARLVMSFIVSLVSANAGYTFHSAQGVRGDDDFSTIDHIEETLHGLKGALAALPGDLASWEHFNHYWAHHPFEGSFKIEGDGSRQLWPDGIDEHGVVRAFASRDGDDFICPLLGIRGHVNLQSVRPLTCDLIDPVTWVTVGGFDLDGGGATYRVAGGDAGDERDLVAVGRLR